MDCCANAVTVSQSKKPFDEPFKSASRAVKIVMAVHHFPPRYTGGAEWRAYRTAAALQARGHTVQVVCVERVDDGLATRVSWEDEIFEHVPVRRLSLNLAAAPNPFQWEYDNAWIGDHLETLLREQHPDVFHLIGGYLISARPLLVARQLGIPTVISLTDFWFLCPRIIMLRSDGQISALPIRAVTCARCLGEERRRYRIPGRIAPGLMGLYWRLQKKQIDRIKARTTFLLRALNQTDAIVSPSQFLRSMFIEAGVEAERIVFARQGRDFPGLDSQSFEKKPSHKLRVGYIGQIAELKGVHILIEAARQLPDPRLTVEVYGDTRRFPGYTARLGRLIGQDKRIRLRGTYRGQDGLSQALRNLDVIVIPSLWYENSPNSILEAFAYRTPVIVSDLGGMSELVQDGENGLAFKVGDAASLAQRLEWLLDDPKLVTRLQAGIKPIKSQAQEMDELETIYANVIARRKSSS
jgi:glycosyltransferase involved in cell wall biosynthesis